jgi:hypothetical protein
VGIAIAGGVKLMSRESKYLLSFGSWKQKDVRVKEKEKLKKETGKTYYGVERWRRKRKEG